MKEFVKYMETISHHKRVDPKILDSVITKELKIRGITQNSDMELLIETIT
jgi:hypothetical protein